MKQLIVSFLSSVLLFLPTTAQEKSQLSVVASFSILGDMVSQVGGKHVSVETLVKPNEDAHLFSPTPNDVKKLGAADVFVINGLDFEGWANKLSKSADFKGVTVVASASVVPSKGDAESKDGAKSEHTHHDLHTRHHHHHDIDPHAWQSLDNAIIYVANIRDALVKADPKHASDYEVNAKRYIAELKTLNTWVKAEIAKVPKHKRKVITTHDAFQYFAKAYGVTFIAPVGVSTESKPSAKDMGRIIDLIRKEHITALFLENISDPRLIKQLQRDGGATIGGTLYSDALSEKDGKAPNFIAMFRHNVKQLVLAMLGNPRS
jgi:zinc/manganese transport system substrate-binding protein